MIIYLIKSEIFLKIFSRYDNSEFNDYIKNEKIILYNNIKNYLKKNTYERSVRRKNKN